ncbi:MAG: polysaccharide biosynthesis protein, partial [Actinomycetota bacterium]|nr:polysaccharide biosynthesis protein [Actinomycetota bacterium]
MSSHDPARWARSHRQLWLSAFDVTAWGCALGLAAWARLDFRFAHVNWSNAALYWALVAALFICLAQLVGLHRGRAALASLEEMMLLGVTAGATGLVCFLVNLFADPLLVPRSVPLISTFLA